MRIPTIPLVLFLAAPAVFPAPSWAASPEVFDLLKIFGSAESVRAGAERDFAAPLSAAGTPGLAGKSAARRISAPAGSEAPAGAWLENPKLLRLPAESVGPLLGSFVPAERLDIHRALLNRQLGERTWDISMASDAAFQISYLSFSRSDALLLRRIEDLNRLRGQGIVVSLDERTSYRFRVEVDIFDPVRRSTLRMEPVQGTQGPEHKMATGQILSLLRGKSYVFRADDREFWVLYATDVDPTTDRPAETRTLAFIHENGINSKVWPVAESALETGAPLGVRLGEVWIALIKTADGLLRIHSGRPTVEQIR